MREIKFRAWDKKHEVMYNWNELLINKYILQSFFGNEHYLTNPPKYFWERMQSTGLKDKNGVDIYEDDIIQHDSKTPPIQVKWGMRCGNYESGYVGFNIEPYFNIDTEEISDVLANIIVIGNIYENPELLNI